MKLNVLGLFAVVLAIAVSSFTVSKVDTTLYLVHKGTSFDEVSVGSYTQTATPQSPVSGLGKINWFRIVDHNNGVIDQTEFNTQFEIYDVEDDNLNKLSDEDDISGSLDVKS